MEIERLIRTPLYPEKEKIDSLIKTYNMASIMSKKILSLYELGRSINSSEIPTECDEQTKEFITLAQKCDNVEAFKIIYKTSLNYQTN